MNSQDIENEPVARYIRFNEVMAGFSDEQVTEEKVAEDDHEEKLILKGLMNSLQI